MPEGTPLYTELTVQRVCELYGRELKGVKIKTKKRNGKKSY